MFGDKSQRQAMWPEFTTRLKKDIEENGEYSHGIICSYGHLIHSSVINEFNKKLVVVHPSLLPLYRGSAPIQYSLINGDTETGISIVEASAKKFDHGDILIQDRVAIKKDDTYLSLCDRLMIIANRSVDKLLDNDYTSLGSQNQYEVNLSPELMRAPKFSPDENCINLSAPLTASMFFNRFRGFFGSSFRSIKLIFEGVYFFVDEMQPLPIHELEVLSSENPRYQSLVDMFQVLNRGELWVFKNIKSFRKAIAIKVDDGYVIVHKGHFAGKKSISGAQFISSVIGEAKMNEQLDKTHSIKNEAVSTLESISRIRELVEIYKFS